MTMAVVIRKEESQSRSVEALVTIGLLQYLLVIIIESGLWGYSIFLQADTLC